MNETAFRSPNPATFDVPAEHALLSIHAMSFYLMRIERVLDGLSSPLWEPGSAPLNLLACSWNNRSIVHVYEYFSFCTLCRVLKQSEGRFVENGKAGGTLSGLESRKTRAQQILFTVKGDLRKTIIIPGSL